MNVSPFAATLSAAALSCDRYEHHGEAVLVRPRLACAIDDRVFASRAAFTRRAATASIPQAGGGVLRYLSYRPVAAFVEVALPAALAVGDRITRSWDGVAFEIVGLFREGRMLCCELREVAGHAH